jgi:glutaredoxin
VVEVVVAEDKKMKYMYLLLVLSLVFISGCAQSMAPSKDDGFAQCLTESDAKMYGTEWCSFCKKQKALFGDSFQYVDYIDCDKNNQECTESGITGYPTWKIKGENYPGVQSFERLSSLTGCKLV